ncbi:MAG: hypothetical protein U1F52_12040 [Burkholderiales bacterium]
MQRLVYQSLMSGLALAICGAAARSGEVNVISCGGAELQTVETSSSLSFSMGSGWGTIRTEPPGNLFDRMTNHCLGAARVVEGKPSLWGHCEWTDKDGDKVLLNYARSDSVGGKYTALAGTGKFSGITATRDYKVIPFPAVPGGRGFCDEGVLRYSIRD